MRKVSMATRAVLVAATAGRYQAATRTQKMRILDEFVAITGFHRKHAMRLLRTGSVRKGGPRPERRLYDEAVHTALIVIWEAELPSALRIHDLRHNSGSRIIPSVTVVSAQNSFLFSVFCKKRRWLITRHYSDVVSGRGFCPSFRETDDDWSERWRVGAR